MANKIPFDNNVLALRGNLGCYSAPSSKISRLVGGTKKQSITVSSSPVKLPVTRQNVSTPLPPQIHSLLAFERLVLDEYVTLGTSRFHIYLLGRYLSGAQLSQRCPRP